MEKQLMKMDKRRQSSSADTLDADTDNHEDRVPLVQVLNTQIETSTMEKERMSGDLTYFILHYHYWSTYPLFLRSSTSW